MKRYGEIVVPKIATSVVKKSDDISIEGTTKPRNEFSPRDLDDSEHITFIVSNRHKHPWSNLKAQQHPSGCTAAVCQSLLHRGLAVAKTSRIMAVRVELLPESGSKIRCTARTLLSIRCTGRIFFKV
jgi:hypothetical protein